MMNKNLERNYLQSVKKCNAYFIPVCLFLFGFFGLTSNINSQTLPGSRPIISAENFISIQTAIDALPETGGLVQLPPGEFEISEPLLIKQNDVCLKGCGTATHIVNKSTNQSPALLLSSGSSEALWRIQISDLRITGNEQSGEGILAKNINEIYLEGISVSYNGTDGIKLDECYEDPRIANCLITYNKQVGLNLIGCHDIVVNGNQFEENDDALRCFDGYNLTMTGNNLDDHLGDGIVIENTYGSVISGNMIEECNGMAIILDRDCYGITLGSNVIAHNGGGIILKDAHGISISANTFTINKKHGVYLGPNCGRITVSGNNFSNSYIGNGEVKRGTEDLAAAGVTLDGGKNILISGNVFSGIQPAKAVLLQQQSKDIFFENNMLIDSDNDIIKMQNSMTKNNFIIGNN